MWPHSFVGDLQLQSCLHTKLDTIPNPHASHVHFGHLTSHFIQPEVHCVVYYFNRSTFDHPGGDRRVSEISTSVDQALVVEANSASVHKPSLDQGLAKFTCCLELSLVFTFGIIAAGG